MLVREPSRVFKGLLEVIALNGSPCGGLDKVNDTQLPSRDVSSCNDGMRSILRSEALVCL